MTSDMKKGLLPITIFVLSDLAMDTGQLTAKHKRNNTSQILKSAMSIDSFMTDTVNATRREILHLCIKISVSRRHGRTTGKGNLDNSLFLRYFCRKSRRRIKKVYRKTPMMENTFETM